ncbi:carbohydrate-binding protein [Paenibacillus phocaensis]|uniref:carbohydrate-binding protein n=1 Tax=Paenibacillus phocaensis TaxID=1776378 RepID=UPI0038CD2504
MNLKLTAIVWYFLSKTALFTCPRAITMSACGNHQDSIDMIAESTGGWQKWSVKNIPLNAGTAVGTHTVYVTFVKSDSTTVANLTWFQFK